MASLPTAKSSLKELWPAGLCSSSSELVWVLGRKNSGPEESSFLCPCQKSVSSGSFLRMKAEWSSLASYRTQALFALGAERASCIVKQDNQSESKCCVQKFAMRWLPRNIKSCDIHKVFPTWLSKHELTCQICRTERWTDQEAATFHKERETRKWELIINGDEGD